MQRLTLTAKELLNLTLTAEQQEQFRVYADELSAWNAHTNLTAITDPADIEIKHLVDSLTCLLVMGRLPTSARIIDVGTGAGFPGLPIKIMYPSTRLTLVESVGKKTDFLTHVVETLNLSGVIIINDRAEVVGQTKEHREQYDWVLARAVAALPVLMEYLLPLCKIGGRCLPQKGESAPQEAIDAEAAIKVLGGHLRQLKPIELPTVVEQRYLVEVEKIAATPPKYPRRIGRPAKKPIMT